ncbi:MAG: hypothetical protein KJ060_10990, partial [Candidatus Hydrogenedentes bacterium]|nr:hypothetical protein [Candidatus Hydrogenedentota bacterium]
MDGHHLGAYRAKRERVSRRIEYVDLGPCGGARQRDLFSNHAPDARLRGDIDKHPLEQRKRVVGLTGGVKHDGQIRCG